MSGGSASFSSDHRQNLHLSREGSASRRVEEESLQDEESEPLLSNQKSHPAASRNQGSEPRSRMTTTPGLEQSVQDFKAQEDRDPEKLNDEVRIKFEEIIAEPEGYHSRKCIWHLSHEVYMFAKDAGYQFLSLFCGCPLAAFWGIIFATRFKIQPF